MTDYTLGDTFDIKFSTRQFSDGVPTLLSGTPSVAAYPDNSVTEITAGITLTTNFDGRAGLNNIRIVATSGNGYAASTTYYLVITAGTVGGVSVVGEVVGEFTLGRSAANTRATDIQSRLPAALVSGRIDASVGAMAANVLTATAINADAITNAKVADNFLSAAKIATDAITAAKIATDAITAAKIAADAIGASELAADAVAEIARAILPQTNTAFNDIPFIMIQTSDHVTPATGLTVTAERSINGGTTWTAATGTVTEAVNGLYHFDASAADMNGAFITFRFTGTGADATFVSLRTAA